MNLKIRFQAALIFIIVLGLIVPSRALAQSRQAPPPEYKEFVAAYEIKDASARIKEFERIKAAYPNSQFAAAIERSILEAKLKALPFQPDAFKAPADWKGKAVLAELFTGSECPPARPPGPRSG